MRKHEKKNYLDERQEQTARLIESRAGWVAYWGLLLCIMAQAVLDTTDMLPDMLPSFAGEFIVFMVMTVYMVGAYLKNNIWARTYKPTLWNNIWMSLLAGVAVGIMVFLTAFLTDKDILAGVAAAGGMFVFTTVLCLIAMSIAMAKYKKNVAAAEADDDEDSEEQ